MNAKLKISLLAAGLLLAAGPVLAEEMNNLKYEDALEIEKGKAKTPDAAEAPASAPAEAAPADAPAPPASQ